jgi:predicted ArsR family transcriptional regulator
MQVESLQARLLAELAAGPKTRDELVQALQVPRTTIYGAMKSLLDGQVIKRMLVYKERCRGRPAVLFAMEEHAGTAPGLSLQDIVDAARHDLALHPRGLVAKTLRAKLRRHGFTNNDINHALEFTVRHGIIDHSSHRYKFILGKEVR